MTSTNLERPTFWVVIPAAGIGLRMMASVPKQYLELNGKTLLAHCVQKFLDYSRIEKIVVALHEDDLHWSSLTFADAAKLMTTVGGRSRAESVFQGLELLRDLAKPQDWVIVHDAVRPCISFRDIDRLIYGLKDHPVGGLLGVPVADTLKKIDDQYNICETLNREKIWRAQTPQMFRYALLHTALQAALTKRQHITDESCAVELLGEQPLMIQGDPRNIKITFPEDLLLAEKFLQKRED